MTKCDYKHFFDWVDAQCNKDGFVTITEMIKACTPDVDNNGAVNVVTYTDSQGTAHVFDEHQIGVNNANIWLAKLPTTVFQDTKMTFAEYYVYVVAV